MATSQPTSWIRQHAMRVVKGPKWSMVVFWLSALYFLIFSTLSVALTYFQAIYQSYGLGDYSENPKFMELSASEASIPAFDLMVLQGAFQLYRFALMIMIAAIVIKLLQSLFPGRVPNGD